MRDLIFISHANPEDNQFAQWLTLQLAREGYPVWCDLTEYLGGEDCWKNADKVIKERACKFLFVLSESSNDKAGVLKELMVAENTAKRDQINDFVIPLKIDNIASEDSNIQLARLKSVSFENGWAGGINNLLKKLAKEQVAKNDLYGPSSVASWWKNNYSAYDGVVEVPEDCLSNWFPISELPETIYVHTLTRKGIGPLELEAELLYPGFQQGQNIITFAAADDLQDELGQLSISETYEFSTLTLLGHNPPSKIGTSKQCRDAIVRLLTMAWGAMITKRQLPLYDLANHKSCFYFASGLCGSDDKIRIEDTYGKKINRQMVGYASVKKSGETDKSKRYWHYAIEASPIVYPEIAFVIKSHVLFSDDGSSIWENKTKLHKARRSQCANWWNETWRDRLLCAAAWLSEGEGIKLTVGNNTFVRIDTHPLLFRSPVSYTMSEEYMPDCDESIPNEEVVDDEYDVDDDVNGRRI